MDRLTADVKGIGKPQSVVLYSVVSDPALGIDTGKLKVFTDETGTVVEWESPLLAGVLAVGDVFTETAPEDGPPFLCSLWGAGAHGTRLYPFRWNGQTYEPVLAREPGGGGKRSGSLGMPG